METGTFDLTRILSVWNVIKAVIIVWLLVQFTVFVSSLIDLPKLPSLAFTFGSVAVILVALLRLNPPPTIKEVAATNLELAEFKQILEVSSPDEARDKIGALIELVTNAEQMQERFEQNESYIKQVEANLKQAKNAEEQTLTSTKRTIFERDELRTNLLQVQNKAAKAFEENEQLYAKNKQIANELETYKEAIDDLANSIFGKLTKEEATIGFAKGYHNLALDKKLLPKSILKILAEQYETGDVETE